MDALISDVERGDLCKLADQMSTLASDVDLGEFALDVVQQPIELGVHRWSVGREPADAPST